MHCANRTETLDKMIKIISLIINIIIVLRPYEGLVHNTWPLCTFPNFVSDLITNLGPIPGTNCGT